jgi:hypothetical protein
MEGEESPNDAEENNQDIEIVEEYDLQESKTRLTYRSIKNRRKRTRKIRHTEFSPEAFAELDSDTFQFLEISIDKLHLQYVVHNLGYIPLNLMNISYMSHATGFAGVLKLYPLNTYENNSFSSRHSKPEKLYSYRKGKSLFPFPTFFWMACPVLNTKVAELEEAGWVQKLLDRLQKSEHCEEYLIDMKFAHESYAAERWATLSSEHIEYIEEMGWYVILT